MQRLQDQVLTLRASKPFGLSTTSRSRQPSLRPSSIAHLFQTSTIVLSNAIGLRSGYGLIWSFSGSSKNSKPVIISATRYGIAPLSTVLCPGLDLKFGTTRNTHPHCLRCLIGVFFLIFPTAVFNSLMCILSGLFESTCILFCSC